MKNKILIITSLIFSLIFLILIYHYFSIKDTYKIIYNYETRNQKPIIVDRIINRDFLICNYNIFKPEIAYILEENYNGKRELSISFYNFQKKYLIFGK